MKYPIRILHWGMLGGLGGVETFIMNTYRHIDKSKIQFDFLTLHDAPIAFEDEIIQSGGKIYKEIYSKRESIIKHHLSLQNFFNKHTEISGVHMHMNSITYHAPLIFAKKNKIPIRIYHSHNSANMHPSNSIIKKYLEQNTRSNVDKYATNLFACSDLAGKYMFGDKSFSVIKNAIDTKKYIFNETVRNQKRQELELGDNFVVGTVGRLQFQKNPEFIIETFKSLHDKVNNSILVIVGAGPLREKVEKMIKEYNLEDCVKLLGQRNDVPELMQAFDCFLLPSRFEGLGIVLIEAQAAGLPCFTSESVVPQDVEITDLMEFISLDKNSEFWANRILEKKNVVRKNTYEQIKVAGFDIYDMVDKLQEFYLSNAK